MIFRGFFATLAILISSTSCATRNTACSDVLEIRISENNELFVGGVLSSLSHLKSVSEGLYLSCPDARIMLSVSAKAKTRVLVDVVATVRETGLKEVEIKTEDLKN